MKVHLLNKGNVWVPKTWDFTEDLKEEIWGNHTFWAREASHPCYYNTRGRSSSYSGFILTIWADLRVFGFRFYLGGNMKF